MRIRKLKYYRELFGVWIKRQRLKFYKMDFEKLKILTLEKAREKSDGRLLRRVRFIGFDDAAVLMRLSDKYDRILHGAKYISRLNALRDLYQRALILDELVAAFFLAEMGDDDGILLLQAHGFKYDENIESRLNRERTDLEISRAEFRQMYGNTESKTDDDGNVGFYSVVASIEHHIGRNLDIDRITVARWIAYVKHAQKQIKQKQQLNESN